MSRDATHGETIAKIDKALQHVYDICQGRQKWTMRVPADVENDSDLILCEALESARKELSTVSETVPSESEAWHAYRRAKHGLDRAAYALFQLKRFADMPQAAIDFVREKHGEACAVYDALPDSAPSATPALDRDAIIEECARAGWDAQMNGAPVGYAIRMLKAKP